MDMNLQKRAIYFNSLWLSGVGKETFDSYKYLLRHNRIRKIAKKYHRDGKLVLTLKQLNKEYKENLNNSKSKSFSGIYNILLKVVDKSQTNGNINTWEILSPKDIIIKKINNNLEKISNEALSKMPTALREIVAESKNYANTQKMY